MTLTLEDALKLKGGIKVKANTDKTHPYQLTQRKQYTLWGDAVPVYPVIFGKPESDSSESTPCNCLLPIMDDSNRLKKVHYVHFGVPN